ncbi:hypothetical protein [Nocardia tengchongensis]|uniref:hypothetical protein n=1 Tax=Nocardia tengchongensis TaxID=2055889 RepID=UPI00361B7CCE
MSRATPLDGEAVIHTTWPLQGPYTAEALGQLMAALDEALRYANHATIGNPLRTLPEPGDGARVVRRFAGAVDKMPQLVGQLARWADAVAADPRLRTGATDGTTAQTHAATAAGALRDAGPALAALQRQLAIAASTLDQGLHFDGDDQDDDEPLSWEQIKARRPSPDERDARREDLLRRARLVRESGFDDYRLIWSSGEVAQVAYLLRDHDELTSMGETTATVLGTLAADLFGYRDGRAEIEAGHPETLRWLEELHRELDR